MLSPISWGDSVILVTGKGLGQQMIHSVYDLPRYGYNLRVKEKPQQGTANFNKEYG
jgi:hypothetical protein